MWPSPTGQGLDELKAAIDAAIAGAPEPPDLGRPRLWIDRVFTIKGTGTVVTGTLQGGTVRLEDELEVIPTGDVVRVRGIQMHNRPVEEGAVGGRVALNVAGLENHLERGDALVRPGQIAPSTVIHVHLKAVPGLPRPLPRDSLLKVYIGSAERLAAVRCWTWTFWCPAKRPWPSSNWIRRVPPSGRTGSWCGIRRSR